MVVERLLIAVWSAMLSFIIVYALGFTRIVSSMVGFGRVGIAADILFVVLAMVFAIIFWFLLPLPMPRLMKALAWFPPLCFLCWVYFS